MMLKAYIFGSYLHGSGRSFLADKTADILRKRGEKVNRISSGEIFRRIAESSGYPIEKFISILTHDIELARSTDVKVDETIKDEIEESLNSNIIPIVDSNLAPFYADGIKILVKVDPNIAGERVYRSHRYGDTAFKSPEDAMNALINRTEKDVARYKELSEDPLVPQYWRDVYRKAVENWGNEKIFDIVVDNSGSVDESISQIIGKLGINR